MNLYPPPSKQPIRNVVYAIQVSQLTLIRIRDLGLTGVDTDDNEESSLLSSLFLRVDWVKSELASNWDMIKAHSRWN